MGFLKPDIPSVIVGMGEVGSSLFNLIRGKFSVKGVDLDDQKNRHCYDDGAEPGHWAVMHVCIPYLTTDYVEIVKEWANMFRPEMIDVCTTVPPGTTELIGENAAHSTTRGVHPHLEEGLQTITKFVGSNDLATAQSISIYFSKIGIPAFPVIRSRTTELAHILNNASYGVNLMFADEMAKLCREYNVDYFTAVQLYTRCNNEGYRKMGLDTKVRTIATPPGGHIGGHCVVQSANLIPEEKRGVILGHLANYNG